MKIPKLLVGRPGYCDFKLAVLAAPFELGAASMQADAAVKQADMQMQANREQIAAQKEENDKAFRRNSSLGQKAQLMAAGLSEQQAMQVIAGNGAVGTAEPADIRSEMEGVDLTGAAAAYGQGLSGVGQAVASTSGELLSSFLSPDGGSLGAFVATPFLDKFSAALPYIDKSKVHSFIDLENWGRSLPFDTEQGQVIHSLLNSNAFNRVKHFSPAIFSTNRFMNSVYTANLDSNQAFKHKNVQMAVERSQIAVNTTVQALNDAHTAQLKDLVTLQGVQRDEMIQRMKVEVEEANLLHQQIIGQDFDNRLKALGIKREEMLFDVITDAQKATMLETAAEAYRNWALYDDEDYIANWVQEQYRTEEGKLALAELEATEHQDALNKYAGNRLTSWLVTMHNLFQGSVSSSVASAGASAGGFAILLKAIKALPK